MTTVVRIDDETKSQLEELRAEVEHETGETVTQRELLARLVRSAVDSRSEFVDSFRGASTSLSDAEFEAFDSGTVSSGVETEDSDVDDVLYE